MKIRVITPIKSLYTGIGSKKNRGVKISLNPPNLIYITASFKIIKSIYHF